MRSVSVMEFNLNTPSEWDWGNFTMYSGRAIEIPKQGQLSNNETEGNVVVNDGPIYLSGSGGFSGSALGHESVPTIEWNLNTPLEWDWENLSIYSDREIEIPKQGQLPNNDNGSIYSSGSGGFPGSALGHGSLHTSSVSASVDSSSRERTNTFGDIDDFSISACEKEKYSWMAKNESSPEMVEASVVSAEPMVGLNLGTQSNCEAMCARSGTKTTSTSVIPTSSSQMKRSRASYQGTSPRCQVEGCSLDLASSKDYHRRHRICDRHSKCPKVIVAGMERRFCQQCSRFHGLSEFDDKKRSCRRRLSDHNARRRRPHTEGIRFGSTQLTSLAYDRRSQMNFFVNRFHIPVPNPTCESGSFKVTLAEESLFSLEKGGGNYRKAHLSSDMMRNTISTLNLDSNRDRFQGVTPQVFDHGLLESRVTSKSVISPEVHQAFSLLSTSSWGLNDSDSTSLDQFGHNKDISLAQPGMPSELQNWELLPSEYLRVEQTSSLVTADKLDSQIIGITQIQAANSFKDPRESPCFYSNQIN